jgi:membrane-associated phospholipid phosphatase
LYRLHVEPDVQSRNPIGNGPFAFAKGSLGIACSDRWKRAALRGREDSECSMLSMAVPPNQFRGALAAILSCLLLVGIAFLFVDRGASTWSHEHLHRPEVFEWPTHIVDPLRTFAALSLGGAALAAVFLAWRPGEHGQTLISAGSAILISAELKELLKYFFGRTWPETWTANNPSWIRDHAFGFHLLHGGSGWESFSSGHTTQVAALVAVTWLRLPRIRWLGVALLALVAVGLWGSDYHFISDIIAGAYLGAACGIGMVALICRRT